MRDFFEIAKEIVATTPAGDNGNGSVILARRPEAFAPLLDGLSAGAKRPAPTVQDHLAAWEALGGSRSDFGFGRRA